MDPSLIKELQLEPLSPRGSDFSYSSEPLGSDSSNSSKPPSDSDRSGRNPQPKAKMAVDQSQRRRPPPLDLHQSSEIQHPEKLKGPQFSGLTDSQEEWKSGCFKGDQETDDEHEVKMESAVDKHPIMGKFSSLFRNKSDKDKTDETNVNPYAQQPSNDTYSAPPREAPSGLPSGPRPGGYGGGLPSGPRPGSSAPPPYSAHNNAAFADNKKRYDSATPNPPIGYGNDRPGAPSGYGGNRYDNAAGYGRNNNVQAPPPRQGGYGGLNDPNPLFDGRQQNDPCAQKDSYGAVPPGPDSQQWQEMTEEEKEDAEINAKKSEIKKLQGETEDSLDRSLAKMGYAHTLADNAMDSMARQREILERTNKSMGEAKVQTRIAKANVKDLEDANKSMFNFYAMSRKRREGLNDERLMNELSEKEERQRMQQEERAGKARLAQRMNGGGAGSAPSLPESDRSKYIFEESDGEQDAREVRIADKQKMLLQGVVGLKKKAMDFSDEVDDQDPMIRRLNNTADIIYDDVAAQRSRLRQFD